MFSVTSQPTNQRWARERVRDTRVESFEWWEWRGYNGLFVFRIYCYKIDTRGEWLFWWWWWDDEMMWCCIFSPHAKTAKEEIFNEIRVSRRMKAKKRTSPAVAGKKVQNYWKRCVFIDTREISWRRWHRNIDVSIKQTRCSWEESLNNVVAFFNVNFRCKKSTDENAPFDQKRRPHTHASKTDHRSHTCHREKGRRRDHDRVYDADFNEHTDVLRRTKGRMTDERMDDHDCFSPVMTHRCRLEMWSGTAMKKLCESPIHHIKKNKRPRSTPLITSHNLTSQISAPILTLPPPAILPLQPPDTTITLPTNAQVCDDGAESVLPYRVDGVFPSFFHRRWQWRARHIYFGFID